MYSNTGMVWIIHSPVYPPHVHQPIELINIMKKTRPDHSQDYYTVYIHPYIDSPQP